MTKNNKLVRDKIPEIIIKSGKTPKYYVIKNDEQYIDELIKKLLEEANEVKENPSIEELADVLEVVIAIANYLKVSFKEVERYRQKKSKSNGAFKKQLFLESVD